MKKSPNFDLNIQQKFFSLYCDTTQRKGYKITRKRFNRESITYIGLDLTKFDLGLLICMNLNEKGKAWVIGVATCLIGSNLFPLL